MSIHAYAKSKLMNFYEAITENKSAMVVYLRYSLIRKLKMWNSLYQTTFALDAIILATESVVNSLLSPIEYWNNNLYKWGSNGISCDALYILQIS